jgi:hypothetical protein
MRHVRTSLFAIAIIAGAASLSAQQGHQQTPPASQPKPEEKADPKASIGGKWNMSVDVPQQGAMTSVLVLKQDGKKLTGTLTGRKAKSIEGEYAEGKITFAMSFQGSNGSMQIGFSGALKENGTLAGTLDLGGQGQTMNWTAERAKEK